MKKKTAKKIQTKKKVGKIVDAEMFSIIGVRHAGGESYGSIAKYLNTKGYTTRWGNEWNSRSLYTVMSHKKIGAKTVTTPKKAQIVGIPSSTELRILERIQQLMVSNVANKLSFIRSLVEVAN